MCGWHEFQDNSAVSTCQFLNMPDNGFERGIMIARPIRKHPHEFDLSAEEFEILEDQLDGEQAHFRLGRNLDEGMSWEEIYDDLDV